MIRIGIVGLANVGKSSLFNLLTKKNILAANYPFATIEPNIGMVEVYDPHLEPLQQIYNSKKIIPAYIKLVDIAGLVKGASQGQGLGNKFLANIREVDAICYVARSFKDKNIVHVNDKVDPITDYEIVISELIISDYEMIINIISKIQKRVKALKKEDPLHFEYETLLKAKESLEAEKPLRKVQLKPEEVAILKKYNFLTLKKIFSLINCAEEDLKEKTPIPFVDYIKKEDIEYFLMPVKFEQELLELHEADKNLILADYGLETSFLNLFIKKIYDVMDLRTFYTCGVQEIHAWTFIEGDLAPKAAGYIHNDFEHGFIRAEIIKYEDILAYKSEIKIKEAGKLISAPKTYKMQNYDICHFLFNVGKK